MTWFRISSCGFVIDLLMAHHKESLPLLTFFKIDQNQHVRASFFAEKIVTDANENLGIPSTLLRFPI